MKLKKIAKKAPSTRLSSMDKGGIGYEDSYWEYVDAIIEQRKKNALKKGKK